MCGGKRKRHRRATYSSDVSCRQTCKSSRRLLAWFWKWREKWPLPQIQVLSSQRCIGRVHQRQRANSKRHSQKERQCYCTWLVEPCLELENRISCTDTVGMKEEQIVEVDREDNVRMDVCRENEIRLRKRSRPSNFSNVPIHLELARQCCTSRRFQPHEPHRQESPRT